MSYILKYSWERKTLLACSHVESVFRLAAVKGAALSKNGGRLSVDLHPGRRCSRRQYEDKITAFTGMRINCRFGLPEAYSYIQR